MAASSPSDDNKKSLPSDGNPLVANDSMSNQGKEVVKEDIDSHPIDEDVNTGLLQLRINDSQLECEKTFICASLPGIQLTSLDWIACCNPNSEIDDKHITYHKLTNSDKSLSTIVARYSKSNIVGLIIINATNSVSLADEFVNKGDIPLIPPVYIVSLDEGEVLEEFLRLQEGVNVQMKVVLVNSEASLPMDHTGPSSHHKMQKKPSHSKMNLHDLLKEHLFADGERIVY